MSWANFIAELRYLWCLHEFRMDFEWLFLNLSASSGLVLHIDTLAECHDMSCVSIIKSNVHSPKNQQWVYLWKMVATETTFPLGIIFFQGLPNQTKTTVPKPHPPKKQQQKPHNWTFQTSNSQRWTNQPGRIHHIPQPWGPSAGGDQCDENSQQGNYPPWN